jgi:OST-HTH/LOTUS domain-containing protein/NYN domain-containing protein
MAGENAARLAVLIDADNARPSITEGLLAEVAKYGTAHVKRAYGDWTGTSLKGWKDQLLAQSISRFSSSPTRPGRTPPTRRWSSTRWTCCTQVASTDSASSPATATSPDSPRDCASPASPCTDSASARRPSRSSRPATSSYLTYAHGPTAPPEAVPKPKAATAAAQLKADTALVNQLRNAVEAASDDDGWAPLASVGNIITKQRPDFDSRNYGYAKLSDLITATTLFELDRRSPGDGKSAVIYTRDKRRRPDE